MTYEKYVLDVLREDHSAKRLDSLEIEEIISEYDFEQIERWLLKQGYDLKEMYENDCLA